MKPAVTDLPLDIYIRVSRVGDRSGESYISPREQLQAAKRWQERQTEEGNTWILRENPPEENVSGGTMDRPIFNRIMQRIRDGESGGIIVFKLDRLARSVVGGILALEDIERHGGVFVSATERQFDLTTADGRIFLQFSLMMAEYFKARTEESWRDSVRSAIERGLWVVRSVPLGFDKVDGRLVPGAQAHIAKEMFSRKIAGESYSSLAAWLNRVAPKEEGDWVGSAVQRMISSRGYIGWSIVEGEKVSFKNETAHDALVSQEDWLKAQGTTRTWSRREGEDVSLLSGLVRCAGCRYLMPEALNRSEGRDRSYYRCRGKRVSGACPACASIRGDGDHGLDAYVENIVRQHLATVAAEETEESTALQDAEREAREANEAVEEFAADVELRKSLGNRFQQFLAPLLERADDAEENLRLVRESVATSGEIVTVEEYDRRPRDERARVISSLVDSIMIRKIGPQGNKAKEIDTDRVWILWHGEGEDWPSKGRNAKTIESWDWQAA